MLMVLMTISPPRTDFMKSLCRVANTPIISRGYLRSALNIVEFRLQLKGIYNLQTPEPAHQPTSTEALISPSKQFSLLQENILESPQKPIRMTL